MQFVRAEWEEPDIALPIRWIAPETLLNGQYAHSSDVWSVGIVIWEIFADGEMPYPSLNNEEVLQKIMQGYRMARPPACPELVWALALQCWTSHDARPRFDELLEDAEDCVDQVPFMPDSGLDSLSSPHAVEPGNHVDRDDVSISSHANPKAANKPYAILHLAESDTESLHPSLDSHNDPHATA